MMIKRETTARWFFCVQLNFMIFCTYKFLFEGVPQDVSVRKIQGSSVGDGALDVPKKTTDFHKIVSIKF